MSVCSNQSVSFECRRKLYGLTVAGVPVFVENVLVFMYLSMFVIKFNLTNDRAWSVLHSYIESVRSHMCARVRAHTHGCSRAHMCVWARARMRVHRHVRTSVHVARAV